MEIKSANFSVKFPIDKNIRRRIVEIEEKLEKDYHQPSLLSIPDDIEPSYPRISVQSKGGHSRITISQISIDLVINFDNEFQNDSEKCFNYVKEKTNEIEGLLTMIGKDSFYYVGLVVISRFPQTEELIKKLLPNDDGFYDFEKKITKIADAKYYVNIQIMNFRDYTGLSPFVDQALIHFFGSTKTEEGLQKVVDVNDRHYYNFNPTAYKLDEYKIRLNYVLEKSKLLTEEQI